MLANNRDVLCDHRELIIDAGKSFVDARKPFVDQQEPAIDQFRLVVKVLIQATIENRLTPDVYSLHCAVNRRDEGDNDKALSDAKSIDFAIPGDRYRGQGLLSLESSVHIEDLGKAGSAPQEEQRGS